MGLFSRAMRGNPPSIMRSIALAGVPTIVRPV